MNKNYFRGFELNLSVFAISVDIRVKKRNRHLFLQHDKKNFKTIIIFSARQKIGFNHGNLAIQFVTGLITYT